MQSLLNGRIFASLLARIDHGYFQNVLLPQTLQSPAKAAQLKHMYLRIIAYGRQLGEDWGELPVPVFPNVQVFAAIVLWLAQRNEGLKVELECMLAAMPAASREPVVRMIDAVSPNAASAPQAPRVPDIVVEPPRPALPESPKLTEISVSACTDYEAEYKALQALFDTVSAEADLLREQLVKTLQAREAAEEQCKSHKGQVDEFAREKTDLLARLEQLQTEAERTVLEKARLMADSAKDSDGHLHFIGTIQRIAPGVMTLDDVTALVEKYSRESHDQVQLIKALQLRCEEAEIARDLLQEKERILLEDHQDATAERARNIELGAEIATLQAELEKLVVERDQLAVRISQKEDEVMQLAGERTMLAAKVGESGQLREAHDGLRAHLSHRERALAEKRMQLKNARQQIKLLQLEKVTVMGHRSKLHKKLKGLWRKFYAQRAEIKDIVRENDELKANVEAAEQMLISNSGEIAVLQEQLLKQHQITKALAATAGQADDVAPAPGQQSLEQVLRQLKEAQELNHEHSALVDRLKEAQELNREHSALADKLAEAQELNREHATLVDKLDEAQRLNREHAALIDNLNREHSALIDKLRGELLQADESLNAKSKNISHLEGDLAESQKALQKASSEITTLRDGIGEANVLLARTRTEHETAKAELEELQKKYRNLSSSRGNAVTEAQEEAERYRRRIDQLKAEVDGLMAEAAAKAQALGQERLRAVDLEQELIVRGKLIEVTTGRHEEHLREAGEERDRLLRELNDVRRLAKETALQLRAKEEDCEQLSGSIAVLQKDLTAARHEIARLEQSSATKSDADLESLRGELLAARQRGDKLESMLESLMVQKEQAEAALQQAMQRLGQQSAQVDALQKDLAARDADLSAAQTQLSQIESRSNSTIQALQQEHQAHVVQSGERERQLRQEVSQMAGRVAEKEAEWGQERAELSAWLSQQQEELATWALRARQMESQVESTVETEHARARDASAEVIDNVESAEMARMKKTMKETLKSIREEHSAILAVWHNLGERLYRDSFYKRV